MDHFMWHRIVIDEGHEVLDDPFYVGVCHTSDIHQQRNTRSVEKEVMAENDCVCVCVTNVMQ